MLKDTEAFRITASPRSNVDVGCRMECHAAQSADFRSCWVPAVDAAGALRMICQIETAFDLNERNVKLCCQQVADGFEMV